MSKQMLEAAAKLLQAAEDMLLRIDGDPILGRCISEYRGGPPWVVKGLRDAVEDVKAAGMGGAG